MPVRFWSSWHRTLNFNWTATFSMTITWIESQFWAVENEVDEKMLKSIRTHFAEIVDHFQKLTLSMCTRSPFIMDRFSVSVELCKNRWNNFDEIFSSGEFKLNITNSTKVWIYSGAIANLSFRGHFENINDLVFFERAFSKSEGRLVIIHCKMDELRRFDAKLNEIKFSDTTIGVIREKAFDALEIQAIEFINCNIERVEEKAITGKVIGIGILDWFDRTRNSILVLGILFLQLYSRYLAFIDCHINTIETEAIAGSGIIDVVMQRNTWVEIDFVAFILSFLCLWHIRLLLQNRFNQIPCNFTDRRQRSDWEQYN